MGEKLYTAKTVDLLLSHQGCSKEYRDNVLKNAPFVELPTTQAPMVPSVTIGDIAQIVEQWHGPEGSKIQIPAYAVDHLASKIHAHLLTLTHQQPSGVDES